MRFSNSVKHDTWFHVAVTFDGGTSKLYQDGVLRDQYQWENADWSGAGIFNRLLLGKDLAGIPPFEGRIDELAFWNIPLSATQLTEIAGATDGICEPVRDGDGDGISDDVESSVGGGGFVPSSDVSLASGSANGTVTIKLANFATPTAQTYQIIFPSGTLAAATGIGFDPNRDSSTQPSLSITGATLPAGQTKTVTIPRGTGGFICISDQPGATQLTVTASCNGSGEEKVKLSAPGSSVTTASGKTVTVAPNNSSITISGLLHTFVGVITDSDEDGRVDSEDLCPFAHPGSIDANSDGCPDRLKDLCFDEIVRRVTPESAGAGEKGIETSLCAKSQAALSALLSGNSIACQNLLGAFRREVNALRDKKVGLEDAGILTLYGRNDLCLF